MQLLIFLLSASFSWAFPTQDYRVQHETPLYESNEIEARELFLLHEGETVKAEPTSDDEYYRVRVKRQGRWRTGFVEMTELKEIVGKSDRVWAVGAGYQVGSVQQKGKSFTLQDQVTYTTDEFKSSASSPYVVAQLGETNFWRAELFQRTTHFRSNATTDVGTSNSLSLQETFVSGLLQKAWTPFATKAIYFGLGFELDRAVSMNLKFGSSELKTSSEDLPTYVGGQIFVGASYLVLPNLSFYAEGRFTDVLNQSPSLLIYEGTAGVLYWP